MVSVSALNMPEDSRIIVDVCYVLLLSLRLL